jgi:hypothetical protein
MCTVLWLVCDGFGCICSGVGDGGFETGNVYMERIR